MSEDHNHLNHATEDRHEAFRGLIERVTLAPGRKRGQIDATLHGELGTILVWLARNNEDGRATKKAQNANTPGPAGAGVSVSVVAGCATNDSCDWLNVPFRDWRHSSVCCIAVMPPPQLPCAGCSTMQRSEVAITIPIS
jgi:hypothetical protein